MLKRLLIAVIVALPVMAQGQSPTPDIRRANIHWGVWFGGTQPDRTNANIVEGDQNGLYMPSAGRLRNLTVKCAATETATFTVTKNGIPTIVSCTAGGHLGCLDWFSVTGDSVDYSAGDFINIAGGGGTTCNITITVLNQDGSAHDAVIDYGIPQLAGNTFCIPESIALGGPGCSSTAVADAFLLPRDTTVTNMSRAGEACTSSCPGSTWTLQNVTTATDILTLSLANGVLPGDVKELCVTGCDVAGGDRLVTFAQNVGQSHAHVIEFGNTGQIITARVAQWSSSPQRYINPLIASSTTVSGATYCNDADGIGQNLRARLNGPASQDIYVYICAGPDDNNIYCGPRRSPVLPRLIRGGFGMCRRRSFTRSCTTDSM